MRKRIQALGVSFLTLGLAACGGEPQPPPAPPPAAQAPPASAPAALPRNPAPAAAKVAIVSPANGAAVKSPVKVQFSIEGMELAPAGGSPPNSGHHHLLVDAGIPADLSQPIVKDEQHLHFGQGQSETEVTLAPGQHTLQLLLGDGNHVPHDPPVASEPITITVE